MPLTAKRIDWMREVMGASEADALIRKAMAGIPGYFYAEENGMTFGTRDTGSTSAIGWDKRGVAYRSDPPWMVDAMAVAEQRGIVLPPRDMSDHEAAERIAVTLRKILADHRNEQ
ncbi:hypothetical protein ACXX82_24255 [Glaciimonas sp. GNP009]